MRRLRAILAYDGTAYHGWQVQPGLPTIQGLLEQALHEIEKRPVAVAGSGRTDAGVHALAQVAAFTLTNPIPTENLRRALNRLLPLDIRVISVEVASETFHPRFDARGKTYEYRFYRSEVCPPFERRYVHHHPYPLGWDRMQTAAPLLAGEHDFSAFAAADQRDASGGSKVRTIYSSELLMHPDRAFYRVRGSGFLKHMVRNLAGALVEVGKGNLTSDELCALLQPGCGRKGGPSLPACGLFLLSVDY